jgi:hypothetical protein
VVQVEQGNPIDVRRRELVRHRIAELGEVGSIEVVEVDPGADDHEVRGRASGQLVYDDQGGTVGLLVVDGVPAGDSECRGVGGRNETGSVRAYIGTPRVPRSVARF